MIIIGITGSIASGKSYALKCFSQFINVKVISSDSEVHKLYQEDQDLINEISKNFPDVVKNNKLDRRKLAQLVFNDSSKKTILESIVHPALEKHRDKLIKLYRRQAVKILVLEIPLLFETGLDEICDYILTVYCNPNIQRARAMKREGMTKEKFYNILSSQMPYNEKISRSDFVINTGDSKSKTARKIKDIYMRIAEDIIH